MNRLFKFVLCTSFFASSVGFSQTAEHQIPISPAAYDYIIEFRSTKYPSLDVYVYEKDVAGGKRLFFADSRGTRIGSPNGYSPDLVYAEADALFARGNTFWAKFKSRTMTGLKVGGIGAAVALILDGIVLLATPIAAVLDPYDAKSFLSDPHIAPLLVISLIFMAGIPAPLSALLEGTEYRDALAEIKDVLPKRHRREISIRTSADLKPILEKLAKALDKPCDALAAGLAR